MSTTDKKMTYRVTKEKYQQGLKKGWNDEDMLRPATYQVRRARHLNVKAVQKQKVTINLDSDILDFYKERATQTGNPPYQTQINNELRRAIEAAKAPQNEFVTVAMLESPEFLSKLASKLKKVA